MEYTIRRALQTPELRGQWNSAAWREAEIAPVNWLHPRTGEHRPKTEARLLYDDRGIYVLFRCEDRYVHCTHTEHQSITSRDSCVEAYLEPIPGKGYLNFEMNCGGAVLSFYITDSTRIDPGIFAGKEVLPQRLLDTIRIYHSMPRIVPVEIAEPAEWCVEYFVPNTLFEHYVGPLGPPAARRWRGNFFKCADDSSHPHWACWNAIGEELNFHDPRFFAPIRFE